LSSRCSRSLRAYSAGSLPERRLWAMIWMSEFPEERQQHDEYGRDGGEDPGRGEGDAGDVAERGEVVDPDEAHDLPTGMLVGLALPRPRPGGLLDAVLEQPAGEPVA